MERDNQTPTVNEGGLIYPVEIEPMTTKPPNLSRVPVWMLDRLLMDPLVYDLPAENSQSSNQMGRSVEEDPAGLVHQHNEGVVLEPALPETTAVEYGIDAMCKALQALRQVFGSDELQNGRAELSEQRDTVLRAEVLPQKSKKYAPKPLELAKKLIQMTRFASYEGQLYTFNVSQGYYKPVMRDDVYRIIMALLEKDLEIRGTAGQLREIYEFIKHDPYIRVASRPPEHLLCFANGILDTITGEFVRGQNPQYFFTWRMVIDFDPSQQACPVFDSLVTHVTGGDPLLAERLLETMAYLLLPSKKMRDIILFQGVAGSGKSVLANLIASFYDPDKVASLAVNQLQDRFAPFQLVGKRLNLCLDLPNGKLTGDAVAFLKAVSGEDLVKIEPKGENGWCTRLECRFLFGSNHSFAPSDKDGGLTDRVRLVPFRFAVSHEARDYALLEKLKLERPAILNRLLQVFCRLRANNFVFAGEDQYGIEHAGIEAGGLYGEFILDCCELVSDAITPTSDLCFAYSQYCRARGIVFSGNTQKFSRQFNAVLPERVKLVKVRIDGVPRNCYEGIKLLRSEEKNTCIMP